jgi:hypothetical protein
MRHPRASRAALPGYISNHLTRARASWRRILEDVRELTFATLSSGEIHTLPRGRTLVIKAPLHGRGFF